MKVLNLEEVVKYQEGAIVSRTLLDRKAGTITVFAFDQGQSLSEHTTPYDAWLYVLDGEAEIRISGTPYRLQAGESIVLPANEPHAVHALTPFKMLLVMIREGEDKP